MSRKLEVLLLALSLASATTVGFALGAEYVSGIKSEDYSKKDKVYMWSKSNGEGDAPKVDMLYISNIESSICKEDYCTLALTKDSMVHMDDFGSFQVCNDHAYRTQEE